MISARNRTYSASAAAGNRPPRRYTQTENRQRRRIGKLTTNGGDFSLAREIAEVCEPLACRIAAADRPARFNHCSGLASVPWLAEAIHEAVGTIVGWLAERDAQAKTEHLKDDPGKRAYATRTLCDLAPRPPLPEIDNAALADGSWVGQLVALADGLDAPLADMLARSWPPGANELRGQTSRSERLDRLLWETIDRAALALERRLDRDEARPTPTPAAPADPRAELESLGVSL